MGKRSHLWKSFASSHFVLEPGNSGAGKGQSSTGGADQGTLSCFSLNKQSRSPGAVWKDKRRFGDGELLVKSWRAVAELHGVTPCLCFDTKQIMQGASRLEIKVIFCIKSSTRNLSIHPSMVNLPLQILRHRKERRWAFLPRRRQHPTRTTFPAWSLSPCSCFWPRPLVPVQYNYP